ncbi:hypothetical protein Pisl_1640 [Pyrobaculum islandicum DSM 4184]|uniref:Uncharacterized protein n=1 Tax=Pyrobaculum islandicum (strain DSM 4184 / JCM 9189 / GEO3) TaxID=384616 RepID=A1RV10_PYRIL|nr:hypothetical protein [Pyrobaculum islandicum]ABL88792.1 hypothetical protein Pisl_1640 [Pyrobaculum islandicum DSM 4184]
MFATELKTKMAYQIAWLLYMLGVRNYKKLPPLKELYAKAMANKWCSKKDRKFCEIAFMKLYNYDIARYLNYGDVTLILTLALYDIDRGDYNLSTLRDYVERGVLPAEIAILTDRVEVESLIPIVAGILKTLGDTTPELLASVWQIVAAMEKRGYVMRDGDRYILTEDGKAIARDIALPQEVMKLKELKYVTPTFFTILNAPTEYF